MNAALIRRLMFFSSWVASLLVGVLILGMTVLCFVGNSVYERLLNGKPLPLLTQFYLDVHEKSALFILVVLILATHAFVVHLAASQASDPISGIWIWLVSMAGTAFAMALYLTAGFIAVLLPLVSIPGGITQITPEEESAESLRFWAFVGFFLVSLLYAVAAAVLMWRRRPKWEAQA